jgi:hypothetical protein
MPAHTKKHVAAVNAANSPTVHPPAH